MDLAPTLTCIFLLCFLLCFSTAGDQETITAESGQNVNLTCRAPNSNIITVAEWSRADLDPGYVFVWRNQKYDSENQHPSFKDRVDSQMKDEDASVILKNVTTDDTGTYKCHVQTEGDRMKLVSTINLVVVGPPGQPRGYREKGGKEAGTEEEGGKEDGGKVDGGKEAGVSRGHYGLAAAGLFLLVLFAVFAIAVKPPKKN